MRLNLELIDDAGVTFGNVVEITSLDQFPVQVGMVCLQIQQMIRRGEMKFVPRDVIVVAQAAPRNQ